MNNKIIDALKIALADSYFLLLKTQNYHWNVTGPNFKSYHLMFEDQYNDLFSAIDLIAERIRSLGAKAPGSFSSYASITNIKEGNENIKANEMVQELASDQSIIVKTLNNVLKAAQNAGDEVTVGIMSDRIEIHQKNLWMLSSSVS